MSSGKLTEKWAKYFKYLHSSMPGYSHVKNSQENRLVLHNDLKKQIQAMAFKRAMMANHQVNVLNTQPQRSLKPDDLWTPSMQTSAVLSENRTGAAQSMSQPKITPIGAEKPTVSMLDRLRRFVLRPRVRDLTVLRINRSQHIPSGEFDHQPGSGHMPVIARDVKAYHRQKQQAQGSQSPILSHSMFSKVLKPMPESKDRTKDLVDNLFARKPIASTPAQAG